MTPESVLIELLERVSAGQDAAVLVTNHELSQWPSVAVAAMKSQKLINKARPAKSAICPGCERECVMPVNTVTGKSWDSDSFIVCDKRRDINRVPIPLEQLVQWRCSTDTVCGFIADHLGLRRNQKQANNSGLREIGVVTGDKRSQMLCLKTDGGLSLIAGSSAVPLAEFIGYQDHAYSLDGAMIRQLVDSAITADDRYTPSIAKREARKLDTQAIYESWRKEYRRLKKARKNMSDVWYSQQIAKMDIAQNRSAETIRKQMKK